ncbi:MAG TPA: pyridoxamine 5'-phosphate oxidase family protein [Acidimicrobiales bacterium]|nr:pyridoxamine 5'-phosphate oxidase family protein [Acidimicrobiales bacterium]
MQLDRNSLEVLSRGECLRLLTQSRVGRVVVTDRALPAAFPVNFAVLDEDVVFQTTTGSKLEAAEGEEVMAFEVDDIDPVRRSGWSVLVQGLARVISDPDELARARALGLEPWAPAASFQFVRIRTELMSGRRLLPRAAADVAVPALVTHIDLLDFAGCPSCGARELLPVSDGAGRNYVCNTCAACWRIDGAELRRVRPETCPGCLFKPMCTAAAVRDGLLVEVDARR